MLIACVDDQGLMCHLLLHSMQPCCVKLRCCLCDKQAIIVNVSLIPQGNTPVDLALSHDDSLLVSVLSKVEHKATFTAMMEG